MAADATDAVALGDSLEELRDRLAVVVCGAELALEMSRERAVRERLRAVLDAAWAIERLLARQEAPAA